MENDSKNLTIPYIFIHLQDEYFTDKTIETINNSEEIHFFIEKNLNEHLIKQIINLPKIQKKYYMYVFNQESYNFCLNNNITPHLCFYSKDILSSPLLKFIDDSLECFWFPGIEDIFNDIQIYSEYLNKINKPICISISDIFNPETNHEQSRLWIKSLLATYKNPLYNKEKELLEENKCSNHNHYLLQNNQQVIIKKIVLGIFGDCVIEDNYEIHNLKSIIINKECSSCDYQDLCINKGIGYSLYKNKYKGCIGLNLFNQS